MSIKTAICEAARTGEIDNVTKDMMLACLEDCNTASDGDSYEESTESSETSVEESADEMRCRIYEAEMNGSITAEERVDLLDKLDAKLSGV